MAGRPTHSTARDLDPIRQGRQGAVGPTRPAVLGDVLVEGVGEEGPAADIPPIPGRGEVLLAEVTVRERGVVILDLGVPLEELAPREEEDATEKTQGDENEGRANGGRGSARRPANERTPLLAKSPEVP